MHSKITHRPHSQVPRFTVALLVALAWGSLAFGGEVHNAVMLGDAGKATA